MPLRRIPDMTRGRKGGLNVQLWQKASLSTGRVGLPTGLQPNGGRGEFLWPSTLMEKGRFLLVYPLPPNLLKNKVRGATFRQPHTPFAR